MKTMWFWKRKLGPWIVSGLWWKQRVFVGVCRIAQGEWEISERDLNAGK